MPGTLVMTKSESQLLSNRFNLAGALSCALCIAFVHAVLSRDSMQPILLRDLAQFVFIALASYSGVYILVTRYWKRPFDLLLPNPVFIALIGALISAILLEVTYVIEVLNMPRRPALVLREFLLSSWNRAIFLAGLYSIVGLPIMGSAWGIGLVIRMVRKEISHIRIVPD